MKKALGLFHGLLDPDDLVDGLMRYADRATMAALQAVDDLRELLNMDQSYSDLTLRERSIAEGYSDDLVRMFELKEAEGTDPGATDRGCRMRVRYC